MRQNQQKQRSRSRRRRSQNPLSRSYESNGPGVKVRGSAAHVAEKYIALAQDASSSSDVVKAENYLQHAEHYLRIIAAVQPPLSDEEKSSVEDQETHVETEELIEKVSSLEKNKEEPTVSKSVRSNSKRRNSSNRKNKASENKELKKDLSKASEENNNASKNINISGDIKELPEKIIKLSSDLGI